MDAWYFETVQICMSRSDKKAFVFSATSILISLSWFQSTHVYLQNIVQWRCSRKASLQWKRYGPIEPKTGSGLICAEKHNLISQKLVAAIHSAGYNWFFFYFMWKHMPTWVCQFANTQTESDM